MSRRMLCLAIPSLLSLFGCKEDSTNPLDVVPDVPSVPALASPANGATNIATPPTLVWRASTGASRYTVQVSTNDSFATLAYSDSSVTDTSREVADLSGNTMYYWRVRASNNTGTSGWSAPTWQFATWNPCPGTPTVTYAGKTYNTVLMGTQCWLRENLDIGTMVPGSQDQTNNGTIEKYCYNDTLVNCATYGGLYQWDEAMQYDTTQGSRGICPPGWHIPTLADFQTLRSTVGGDGNALKAIGQGTGAGAGTNTSGFSALLAGYRKLDGFFNYLGGDGYFWSSTQYDATFANLVCMYYYNAYIYLNYRRNKPYGYSVRCLED